MEWYLFNLKHGLKRILGGLTSLKESTNHFVDYTNMHELDKPDSSVW